MPETTSEPSELETVLAREMNDRIVHILKMVTLWDAARFVPMPKDALPDNVQSGSSRWHQEFFVESCPLVTSEHNCRVVLADNDEYEDAVICDARIGDRLGTVYETTRQIALFAPMGEIDAKDPDALPITVRNLLGTCLTVNLLWKRRARSEIEGPFAISTNPYQSIWTAPFWHSRVDAGTLGNRVYVFLYKRINQLVGFPAGLWFDDEFRGRVKKMYLDKR